MTKAVQDASMSSLESCLANIFCKKNSKFQVQKNRFVGRIQFSGVLHEDFVRLLKYYVDFLRKPTVAAKILRERYQKQFNRITAMILIYASEIDKRADALQGKKVQSLFRAELLRYIHQSKILKRFLVKPQGYPGDYFMFELIYDGCVLSKKVGIFFDRFVLEYPLAQSMINRKEIIKELLLDRIKNSESSQLKILNLGCGACREVRELLTENVPRKNLIFTMMDQDKDALFFAKSRFPEVGANVRLDFCRKNMLDVLRGRKLGDSPQDIIYTIGLVDYFGDRLLIKFLRTCLQMLRQDGVLIIGFCSSRNLGVYSFLRWYSDWFFYYRNPIKTIQYIKENFPIVDVKMVPEKGGNVFFLLITRKIRH